MESLTAGSPSCNCKNPDTCIHSFTLKVKDRSFNYRQDRFISFVEAVDKGGEGIPVSLSLQGKGCVTDNPLCPQGYIMNSDSGQTLKKFNNGITNYRVSYNTGNLKEFQTMEAIDFLTRYVLSRDTRDIIPATKYFLRVGQCRGEPFSNETLSFKDGLSQILKIAPRDALWSYINVYPEFSWKCSIVISANQSVIEHKEKILRKEQKKINRSNGLPQRGSRGWTKLPKNTISNKLGIEGNLSYTINNIPHEYKASIQKNFERKSNDLSLIEAATKTVDSVLKAISTEKEENDEITLLEAEITYPKIEIKGGGELKENDKNNNIYIEKQVSVSLSPLVGMSLKLDLIQAFAAWYKSELAAKIIREGLASQKGAYEEGKDAIFVDPQFYLIIEGNVNFSLSFKINEKNEWEWQANDSAEAKLALIIEAKVSAGMRFWSIEGAFDVGGKAEAEVSLGFDNTAKEKIDLVLYHNGIIIKAYVSYQMGSSTNPVKTQSKGNGIPSKKNATIDPRNKTEQEWIIHDKLEKEKSKYRINIC